MIFDGRVFARELQSALSLKVEALAEKLGRKPVLAAIYNPEDRASRVYTEIKANKAEEIGIEFVKFSVAGYQLPIGQLVEKLNSDRNIDGILIQTPLIDRETDRELCKLIDAKKDCDGLNPESGVIPATSKAVLKILDSISQISKYPSIQYQNMVVVGQRGMVGGNLMIQLSKKPNIQLSGMSAGELDLNRLSEADVIISATGREGLIKPEMVKTGVVCIDVGYPKGDFDPECAQKASFFTPVPGGVGPVTVVCLFENLAVLVGGS